MYMQIKSYQVTGTDTTPSCIGPSMYVSPWCICPPLCTLSSVYLPLHVYILSVCLSPPYLCLSAIPPRVYICPCVWPPSRCMSLYVCVAPCLCLSVFVSLYMFSPPVYNPVYIFVRVCVPPVCISLLVYFPPYVEV